MREADFIRAFVAQFPRSPDQANALFGCDAEIVRIGGALWGLTLDDFSPDEDLFGENDPARLGANLAVATVSDLLAAGVEPTFFMQALSLSPDAEPDFTAGLVDGIRSALDALGCTLIGGDLGMADPWRYTGFAMGPVVAEPLQHTIPGGTHTLWVSGTLGDANLAAFQGRPAPRLEPRLAEARAAWGVAAAGIDTSGGLLDAVWVLHRQSPGICLRIELDRLPLDPGATTFALHTGVPAEAVLLGGAGEYELLFAVPEDGTAAVAEVLTAAGLSRVGSAASGNQGGIELLHQGQPVGRMTRPPPCPRAAGGIAEHAGEVLDLARQLFGGEGTYGPA